jgi:hypothetical protein
MCYGSWAAGLSLLAQALLPASAWAQVDRRFRPQLWRGCVCTLATPLSPDSRLAAPTAPMPASDAAMPQ